MQSMLVKNMPQHIKRKNLSLRALVDNFSFSYFLGQTNRVSLRSKSDPFPPLPFPLSSVALLLGSSLPEERSRHFIFGCRNKHLLCSHSLTLSVSHDDGDRRSLPSPPLVGPIRGPRGGTR